MATHRQRYDSEEWRMCSALDKLDEYDQYEASILPLLRRAVDKRWSTRRIRKELASFSQALVIQQGLCGNVNRSSQIAAIQDVLNRYEGRPCRRKDKVQTHSESREELIEIVRKVLRRKSHAR